MAGEQLKTGTAAEVDLSALHNDNHKNLLRSAGVVTHGQVDAIIVPTARPIAYLRKAIALADALGCTLVALCSKRASAHDVELAVKRSGVKAYVAIDVDFVPAEVVPSFETTTVLEGDRFNRLTDTSFKRNLGLLLAKLANWERIVFLDDDIDVPDVNYLRTAAGLLDTHSVVGLANGGYPDNSVVCHAYREVGGPQKTFIGGGALAVGAASYGSFFPNIYNEDWFFLLDDDRLRSTTVTGLAVQSPYDPFANDRRARSEELGDCLAEGVFRLLDKGARVQDADADYWRRFLSDRRRFIDRILDLVDETDHEPGAKRRMVAALKAARGRSWLVDPALCVEYLRVWRTDRDLWARHLDNLAEKHTSGLDRALYDLGLKDKDWSRSVL